MKLGHFGMLPARAFRALGGRLMTLEGKGDAPAAPDYTGAAKETAAGNLEAARVAAKANRADQYTPYGNLIYTQGGGAPTFNQSGYDSAMQAYQAQQAAGGGDNGQAAYMAANPGLNAGAPPNGTDGSGVVAPNQADYWIPAGGDPDHWTSTLNLSPTGQQLLDYNNAAQLGLGKQTGLALDRVNEGLSKPFDYGSVQDLSDQSYAAQTARLDPEWQTRDQQFQQQMANQGISAGGEAYNNAARTFGQQRNDAYSQARLNAQQMMPQTYQLASSLRSQPLNELNALRTGAQVTNPTFQAVPQQQTTAGPDMLGAAQAQGQYDTNVFNQEQQSSNSMTSGLMSMAAMAAMYF